MTIIPIPSGTRDVLPDEMRELRAIGDAVRAVFEEHGYGEVATPALEYEEVLARGGAAGRLPAYRVVDDHGAVLALRSDMTVPIARVAATRYATADPPLRFSYLANVHRTVRPHRGQMREFLQAGIELIGSPAPDGTAEALTVLCRALDAVGLRGYRIGLGDASLVPSLLSGVDGDAVLAALAVHDFVALEREVARLDLEPERAEALVALPQRRGGPEVLDLPGVEGLRRVLDLLEPAVAARVIFDLGLVRRLGYYTGAVFEIYDPALGEPLGGGGRYDDLLARFGRPLPAVGFAVGLDALHVALAGEGR
ncbi:MAG TPA: ATP phosphoribosyltransferase regulatory subunit [Solirubrobacteraceae bacterium]